MSTPEDRIDDISLMFEAARSYIGGAKIIIASKGIEEDGVIKHPTLPVITCSSFAIEILLKLLLKATSTAKPEGDGHNLFALFNALPSALQVETLEFQASYTDLSQDEAREFINRERDTFKRWRYPYEKKHLETQPTLLFQLALALSDYVKSRYPIERSDNGWLKESTT